MKVPVKEPVSPCLNALANMITFLLVARGMILAATESPVEPPSA
jgi:hypothetical protein